jgi:hypothetical protein
MSGNSQNPQEEPKTTDTDLRYLGYFGRLRNLVAVKAAALSSVARYSAYTSDVVSSVSTTSFNISKQGRSFSTNSPPECCSLCIWSLLGICNHRCKQWRFTRNMVTITHIGYKDWHAGKDKSEVTRTVLSRTIFQSLASMALPAFAIHTQVHLFQKVFAKGYSS